MITRTYIEYFDIDKEFHKSVNEFQFLESPNLWTKFYPHERFVDMVEDVVSILSGERTSKESEWVEGAYGVGKTYAVLTLKKILDVSKEEVEEYFRKNNLPDNLLGKINSIKENCKLLTVFRSRSADILSGRDLIVAIQESLLDAMREKGMTGGENALRERGVIWLSDPDNKKHFHNIINSDENARLVGKSVDEIIDDLQNSKDKAYVVNLVKKVDEIGREKEINIFRPDIKTLLEWIKGIIKDNDLSAIVFIWDEFTEFFQNNKHRLTDFQEIVALSTVTPFYLIPVTHVSGGLFDDNDKDKKKILGRFIEPTARIELPDGIAFELIGAALQKKNNNPVIQEEWKKVAEDINGEIKDARLMVAESLKLDEEKIKGILPLHPYAALTLKYLAEKFKSNQRSMFDFIKGACEIKDRSRN